MTLQKLPRPRVNVSVFKYDKVVLELELCQKKLQRLRKETARLNGTNVRQLAELSLLRGLLREHMAAFICDTNDLHNRSKAALILEPTKK
jgi:hypothetical protein